MQQCMPAIFPRAASCHFSLLRHFRNLAFLLAFGLKNIRPRLTFAKSGLSKNALIFMILKDLLLRQKY